MAGCPGGTYAIYSENKEVDVILTATRAGLSNDSTVPADWNGDANKTLPTDEQVTFYRSLSTPRLPPTARNWPPR